MNQQIQHSLATMHDHVTRSSAFSRMIKSVEPFCNYFGINQFYYCKTFFGGYYTTINTNTNYHERILNHHLEMLSSLPAIRDPKVIKPGVFIESDTEDQSLVNFFELTRVQFNINFTLAFRQQQHDGATSIGFGTPFEPIKVINLLLSELPLVYRFIEFFLKENKKLIHLAHESQIAITPLIGPRFFETSSVPSSAAKKEELLKLLGIDTFGKITNREKDILRLLCFGYPVSYIGKELHLSPRTIENTIAILKSKLNCSSKVELINKSIDITQMI